MRACTKGFLRFGGGGVQGRAVCNNHIERVKDAVIDTLQYPDKCRYKSNKIAEGIP
ncbi:MAG: hypothetical protein JWO80_2244 [Bryobacterales bacterium]|nr:hypothetical protein [Bryobacterales bacterium]